MNAKEVLNNVNSMLAKAYSGRTWDITEVYDELGIFDWWKDRLTVSNLKDMRKFLETAIKYGYTGYVCFKVGVRGCANGMWSYKEESEDRYAPKEGGCLYRSFTPAYVCWEIRNDDGEWTHDLTLTKVKEILK